MIYSREEHKLGSNPVATALKDLKAFLRLLRGVTLGLEIRKITIKGFDVLKLHPGNLHEWNGGRVLRLMMSKTRAVVNICLTAPAAAIIDKYVDRERLKLLPVHSIISAFLRD